MQHRNAISDWTVRKKLKKVLDYGGGFGTLARLIAEKDPTISIDIYEPYPSNYAILRTADYNNIQFIDSISNPYDCIVSIDVLEHVSDPLTIFSQMSKSVKKNGYLIIANNFWPVIKCHLPSTFHLRYTFDTFARLMGLELLGPCEGSHAHIYQKRKDVPFNWYRIRMYEQVSRILFPFLNILHVFYRRVKKIVL
jgi:2-polyprenyl-6-hydroxyphenyl methylase/3-demethylubiquinone-9 3-methyltransferase